MRTSAPHDVAKMNDLLQTMDALIHDKLIRIHSD